VATAHVNGCAIAWQQMGEGPHLILVHGLAASRAFWFVHALQLQTHYTITLFDLPGHGYSGPATGGYDAVALGQLLLDLMDTLDIPQAVLAGHSYGGGACVEAAVLAPERVQGLALFDVRINRLQPFMRMADVDQPTPFEQLMAADPRVDWASEDQVGTRFLEMAARHRVEGRIAEADDSVIPFAEGRGALKAARQWLALMADTEARSDFHEPGAPREALAALDLPTLLMYAERSRCQPSGEALRQMWPHAWREVVPAAGHFFPITHAGLVTERLLNWGTQPRAEVLTP
jgi:pimeloyl-ACP methyl ester carboxylesterase